MESIKEILNDVIKDLQAGKVTGDSPEILLQKALPKREQGHVQFRYLRKGILGVAVDSSARLYQLNLQKSRLLARIGKKINSVKDIRFYIGDI